MAPLPSGVFRRQSEPSALTRWLPLPLRMAATWLLMWLLMLSLARLAFHIGFAPAGVDWASLGAALKLGLRFDLRLALWLVLPVLLVGWIPLLAPWSRQRGVRIVWQMGVLLVSAAVVLIYIVDAGHYAYLHQRINASVVNFAKDASTSAGMVWSTYPVLRLLLVLVVLAAAFTWFSKALFRQGLDPAWPGVPTTLRRRVLSRTLWTMGTALLVLLGIHGRFSQYPLRWSDAFELPGGAYSASLALNPVLSLYDTAAFRKDTPDLAAVRKHYPRMAAYLKVDHPNLQTLDFSRQGVPRAGALPRRLNVVVVMLESYSGYKSSVFNNPLDPSPEIAKLAKDGVLFTRLFSAHGGTARGVFASLTGIPDVQVGDTSSRDQQAVDQHLIMNAFKDHAKWYFIGGSTTWGNVRGFLKRSSPDLHIVEEGQFKVPVSDVWGISDHDLFKETLRHLHEAQAGGDKRPFFAVVQTAGNHRPYTIPQADLGPPDKPGPFLLRDVPADQLTAAGFSSVLEFNAYRYLDWSVGRFFEMARQQPWFNDTVFMLYGDHGIMGQPGANMPSYFGPLGLTNGHNMLLLYSPSWLKPKRLDMPANQVDVMPTLAGLFDQPYLNTSLGRDLLDPRFNADRSVFTFMPEVGLLSADRYVTTGAPGRNGRAWSLQDPLVEVPVAAREKEMQQLAQAWYETARYMVKHNPPRPHAPPVAVKP